MAQGIALAVLLLVFSCDEHADEDLQDVPVSVRMVAVDDHDVPVLVLEEDGGPRWLPIWIGTAEARSIATQMAERSAPRPNTHDLAKRVIEGLEGEVVRVVVTELRNGTYFAILSLRVRGRIVDIDARPSDAIAIALRVKAPILVRATLFEEAGEIRLPEGPEKSVRWAPRDAQPIGTRPATRAPTA